MQFIMAKKLKCKFIYKRTVHAKFQDHRTSGSGEEDFLRFLPYMGMAAILVM